MIALLAIVALVVIVGLLIAVTRNGSSGSDSSPSLLDTQVRTPVKYYRDDQLVRLRAMLSRGCPGCGAALGITSATGMDKVKATLGQKCFYCGFDFAGLSAESGETEEHRASPGG